VAATHVLVHPVKKFFDLLLAQSDSKQRVAAKGHGQHCFEPDEILFSSNFPQLVIGQRLNQKDPPENRNPTSRAGVNRSPVSEESSIVSTG
jgi:hypothetical protein